MSELMPKSFFPRGFSRLSFAQFPSLWEDFEDEMQQLAWDQSGLSISEDSNHIFVEAKMPGLKSDDIDVTLENGILKIHGERKEEEEDKARKYHRKASYSYSFRVSLPTQIDESNPDANYKDGVMSINFKKLTESKGKKIPIK